MIRNFLRGLAMAGSMLALTIAGPSAAMTQAQPAPFNESAQNAFARSAVAAINGTDAERKAWIEANISTYARDKNRGESWQVLLDSLVPHYGKLTLTRVRYGGNRLSIDVATEKRKGVGRLSIAMRGDEPGKISQIWKLPFPPSFDETALPATLSEADALKRVQAIVTDRIATDDLSGVVLVTHKGKTLFQAAGGYAERNFMVPNAMNTRFNLGSMDKMFTATSIGQLIEAGKLSLDTRLIEILPDYPNKDAAEKTTVRHLLTHRAGLGMLWDRKAYDRLKPYDKVSDLIPIFAAEPLLFQPGEGQDYSNEGFLVLGAIVEKLSGQTYYDYVRDNVFKPAGMTDTGYPIYDAITARRAVGYQFVEEDPLGLEPRISNWGSIGLGYRGNSCGGGYATASDMARFLDALKAGKLISPAMVSQMTALDPQSIPEYGMGFIHIPTGQDSQRGHDGGGPFSGINSSAKKLWNHDYDVIVLGNYDAPFAQDLADAIARILERVPVAK